MAGDILKIGVADLNTCLMTLNMYTHTHTHKYAYIHMYINLVTLLNANNDIRTQVERRIKNTTLRQQMYQRLATGWTVRGSNPSGS